MGNELLICDTQPDATNNDAETPDGTQTEYTRKTKIKTM